MAETYRNLCAVGARPLAITNCLNFGNPQRPEIMAQLVHALDGMGEACRALDFPVVSGNVSLYNESKATGGGSAILPTPAIGGVGLLEDYAQQASIGFKAEGDRVWLVGQPGGHLAQSVWLRALHGREEGLPPQVDLAAEKRNGEFVRHLVGSRAINAVHDISDGGLLVALAEMALAGGLGCDVTGLPWEGNDLPDLAGWLFGEDQARYLVTTSDAEGADLLSRAEQRGVPIAYVGSVGGDTISIGDAPGTSGNRGEVPLAELRAAHESFFREWMEG